MNYLRSIGRAISLLAHSFTYSYVPPLAECTLPMTLAEAVSECSIRGKLLVLHLTKNKRTVDVSVDLPEETFVILTAPFNSPFAYEASRFFDLDSLPFIGVFFCPTSSPSDAQLINRITTENDIRVVLRQLETSHLAVELAGRRSRFEQRESSRVLINEQDSAYEEVLREAQRRKEEKRRIKQANAKKEEEKQTKVAYALKRYHSMPAEPQPDTSDTVLIQFLIDGKDTKRRVFRKSDKAQMLLDFVAVDCAPHEPVLRFGFPARSLSPNDRDKTLAELGFARKEIVTVEPDDDEL